MYDLIQQQMFTGSVYSASKTSTGNVFWIQGWNCRRVGGWTSPAHVYRRSFWV